ncbi:MAG: TetR/AcrR family transcriptional regulator [Chloroflexota bacterium]
MNDPIQQQLIAARRSQILDAAAKVFAEKGFHPATTKDIARQAGISEGTIYHYFDNKMALLFGILDRMKAIALQDADLTNVSETDFRSFLKATFRHPLMALKADNFELFRVVVAELMVNQHLRAFYFQDILEPTIQLAEAQLQLWAAQNVIKPINIKLTMRVVSGLVFGLILEHIMGDKLLEASWDDLPDFLTDMILDGIGNEKS